MKKFFVAIVLIVIFSSCEKIISDFQSKNFIKFFGGGLSSMGYDVCAVEDGYVLVGFDNTSELKKQVFVIRIDKFGNTIWQRQYGTGLNEEGRIVKVFGGNIYIAGLTSNELTGSTHSFILKLNSQGDSIMHQSIGLEYHSLVINDIHVDESAIHIAGETYADASAQPRYYLARYSHDISLLWEASSVIKRSFKKVFLSSEGHYYIVGENSGVINSLKTHINITKFELSGGLLNSFNLDASDNHEFADAFLHNNELVVVYNQMVGNEYNARIVKIDCSDFSTVWHVESGLACQAKSLTRLSSGTITLCGEKDNTIQLYQLDDAGNITLSSEDTKPLSGFVETIIATADDGIAIIGATTIPEYGTMMQLIKTDKDLYLFEP